MRHHVFVYGTLRRGGCYHHLLGGAVCLADGYTEPVYELVDLGDYPAALEGGASAIYGELYAVDDAVLAVLDDLEEVPDYYRRVQVEVVGVRAHFYVLADAAHAAGRPRIGSGRWPID